MKEMKNPIELITKNWGLKILALILAIVIYHSLKPAEQDATSTHDRTTFQR